jgi:hypothetical protein
MQATIAEAFGSWAPAPGQPAAPREVPDGPSSSDGGGGAGGAIDGAEVVWLVDRPGAPQVWNQSAFFSDCCGRWCL